MTHMPLLQYKFLRRRETEYKVGTYITSDLDTRFVGEGEDRKSE